MNNEWFCDLCALVKFHVFIRGRCSPSSHCHWRVHSSGHWYGPFRSLGIDPIVRSLASGCRLGVRCRCPLARHCGWRSLASGYRDRVEIWTRAVSLAIVSLIWSVCQLGICYRGLAIWNRDVSVLSACCGLWTAISSNYESKSGNNV